jgi:hypothetical protein
VSGIKGFLGRRGLVYRGNTIDLLTGYSILDAVEKALLILNGIYPVPPPYSLSLTLPKEERF